MCIDFCNYNEIGGKGGEKEVHMFNLTHRLSRTEKLRCSDHVHPQCTRLCLDNKSQTQAGVGNLKSQAALMYRIQDCGVKSCVFTAASRAQKRCPRGSR